MSSVRCARCHHHWTPRDESEVASCPNCGAEAGIEADHAPGLPMRLFGVLVGLVLVTTLVGGLVSRFLG